MVTKVYVETGPASKISVYTADEMDRQIANAVPNTRTVNAKALSANIVLTPDDLDDAATTHKFVLAADITKLGNLAGTNSGDQTLPTLVSLGVNATAAELNALDGITATVTDLNYVDGVTSSIQTQLNAKQATLTGLTATVAELNVLDGITATVAELNYTDGVTSAIQTQLDAKAISTANITDHSVVRGAGGAKGIQGSGVLVDDSNNLTGIADATLSGLLSLSGGQIKFPATQNPSSDANTLDDYEEGTWTPVLNSFTVVGATTLSGKYTKLGKMVFCTAQLVAATSLASVGNTSFITGLPFSVVVASTVSVSNTQVANIGIGLVDIDSCVYTPTWPAAANKVYLSFMYEA